MTDKQCHCRRDCILRDVARTPSAKPCDDYCAHFVSLHGASGKGGRIGSANIPEEYRRFTIKDNPVRESQAKAYRKLDAVVESFRRMFDEVTDPKDRIKNVYLWSRAAGTGKTATASALANEWVKTHYLGSLARKEVPEDDAVYVLDMAEFQTQYNLHNRPNAKGDAAEQAFGKYVKMMQHAKDVGLLVMDDIGARGATEAFRNDVHAIVNHRYTKKKPTIYTSNVPMDELEGIFDAKLYDRVRDLTTVIEFEGESKRGKRK